jgi:hypothetical protein
MEQRIMGGCEAFAYTWGNMTHREHNVDTMFSPVFI